MIKRKGYVIADQYDTTLGYLDYAEMSFGNSGYISPLGPKEYFEVRKYMEDNGLIPVPIPNDSIITGSKKFTTPSLEQRLLAEDIMTNCMRCRSSNPDPLQCAKCRLNTKSKNRSLVNASNTTDTIACQNSLVHLEISGDVSDVLEYTWSNGVNNASARSVDIDVLRDTVITVEIRTADCTEKHSIKFIARPCNEICANGIDDDGDGHTDCTDPDCSIRLTNVKGDITKSIDTTSCLNACLPECIKIWPGNCLTNTYIPNDCFEKNQFATANYYSLVTGNAVACPDTGSTYIVEIIGLNGALLTSEEICIQEQTVDSAYIYSVLRCAFMDTDTTRLQEVAGAFARYADEFEINTPLRIAHFLGQIGHETADLTRLQENCNYSPLQMICVFGGLRKYGSLFEGYESDQDNCNGMEPAATEPPFPYSSKLEMLKAWAQGATITDADGNTILAEDINSQCDLCTCAGNRPRLNVSSNYNNGDLRVKTEYIRNCDIFDVTYACRLDNGAPGTGDGSAYAGVGFLHLTGREKIVFVQNAWNADETNENNPKDFYGEDAHELFDDIDVAMKTSMYYWISQMKEGHNANYWADRNDHFRVSSIVNRVGATRADQINGYSDRVSRMENILNKCLN